MSIANKTKRYARRFEDIINIDIPKEIFNIAKNQLLPASVCKATALTFLRH